MNAKILAVEDNETLQFMLKMLGKSCGVQLDIAGSCAHAVEAVMAERYDMVFMDWTLPDHTGLSCVQFIREKDKERLRWTPIIAMTGHANDEDRLLCLESGMDDFLAKPFTIAQFSEMIQRWLGRASSRSA